MATLLQDNPEKNIVYVTVLDKFILKEFEDALKKITRDYPPSTGILLDASSMHVPVGNVQFSSEISAMRKMIVEMKDTKIAIVTSSDFTFGMGGKYEMLSSNMPQNVMIFDNFMEAERWLTEKEA